MEKQIEIYDMLNARCAVTDEGVEGFLTWGQIKEIYEISFIDSLTKEPVRGRFVFKAIPRLLDMIESTERARSYIAKLADTLESEGYSTDANIVRECIKMMNGEKVAMATMDKEPVSEDLEIAGKEWLRPQLDKSYANYGETKMMELTHFDGYAMLDAIEFGAQWQKEKLIEKACEWLKQNVIWGTKFIERFKKYMEE